jgi:hypothetical protein
MQAALEEAGVELAKFPGFRHYNSPTAQLIRHARSLRTCARAPLNIVSSLRPEVHRAEGCIDLRQCPGP